MSNNAITKPLHGSLFMKETVDLAPKEDGTARSMTVLQVATDAGVVRITDFSNQHEALELDKPVRLVYEESTQMRNERPVTFRNLITASQG